MNSHFSNQVYEIEINGPTMGQSTNAVQDINGSLTITNGTVTTGDTWTWNDATGITTYPYYNFYTWTNTVYLYQVRCPRKGCRRYNWLELDKITPCSNCGSELKAVSKKPDFEIEVG